MQDFGALSACGVCKEEAFAESGFASVCLALQGSFAALGAEAAPSPLGVTQGTGQVGCPEECSSWSLPSRSELQHTSQAAMLGASFPFPPFTPLVSPLGAAFPVFPSLRHSSCALPLAAVLLCRCGSRWLLSQLLPGMLQRFFKALWG